MVVEETIEMVQVILEAATAGPLSSLDWRWKEEKSHSENLHDFISVVIVELDDLEGQRSKLIEELEQLRDR